MRNGYSRFASYQFGIFLIIVAATLLIAIDGVLNEDREPVWFMFFCFGLVGSWRWYQKWRALP